LFEMALEGAAGSAGRTESTSAVQVRIVAISSGLARGPQAGEGDVMAVLPARPDLDQLRHQAKDLLSAAKAGDAAAAGRIRVVSGQLTLASAQLAIARDYGFASWPQLKAGVQERATDLAEKVTAFCEASVRDWTGLAARMLAATPEIAGYNLATAVLLGDAARVRAGIERDPAAATRPDARSGWTPLHAVCASRWHRLDPARADGMAAVAELLLDAGADPNARAGGAQGSPGHWTVLRCAIAGAANPPITRLLLERGAVPDDHDLYLACFGGDDSQCLRLLLGQAGNVAGTSALGAAISTGDTVAVRLLLEAGADPGRPLPGDPPDGPDAADRPVYPVGAAVEAGCPAELIELLLRCGADPGAPGQDGSSPYRVAIRRGRTDIAALLTRHGASAGNAETDRFLSACRRADRAEAEQLARRNRDLAGQLASADQAALVEAASEGLTEVVRLMLDVGFPLDARGEDGATALHAAAFSGSADTVRLLLDRGAGIESRDTSWDSTPLDWAKIGSGIRPGDNPSPDWIATVRTLLEAGASIAEVTLAPDDLKPASGEIARLLRSYGARDERPG
jgi:ankyrin repeat protein